MIIFSSFVDGGAFISKIFELFLKRIFKLLVEFQLHFGHGSDVSLKDFELDEPASTVNLPLFHALDFENCLIVFVTI